jgi:hypothetical protein
MHMHLLYLSRVAQSIRFFSPARLGAVVYSFVAENMQPGTLRSHEYLRKRLFEHVTELVQFFNRPENECIVDSNQFLRLNFCVVVRCIAQDLGGMEELFDKA